ncbi:hypothetical protein OESDEN_06207 [Oesophagostomum dentatum]|uniref:DUF5641 domain-containing protein n=1 Tax=Oesophagostomum dentatum TaxID=61180 RepID=A0A0B1T8G9_OESDE|nr:hypothetical protein OESDEN_06207 [Oesophagostomum dentatum]
MFRHFNSVIGQKYLCITYKTNECVTEDSDPDFHTPAEAVQLRTRMEAEEALETSSQIVDKFWKVWNDAYLTSLREYHKHKLDQGRSTTLQPEVGQVVLLQDAILPRNKWKLAKIIKLERSTDGEVREVQINQSNGKIGKRPRDQSESLETAKHVSTEENTNNANEDTDYNLRPSRTRKYPYSDDSEVYTVNMVEQNVAESVSNFRMDAKQAASTLLKELNAKTRPLFEEEELRQCLDILYDDISSNFNRIRTMESTSEEIQNNLTCWSTATRKPQNLARKAYAAAQYGTENKGEDAHKPGIRIHFLGSIRRTSQQRTCNT